MEEKITPKFAKQGGLVPAIVQDHISGQVLMLAYMNEEAWNMTLKPGRPTISAAAARPCGIKATPAGTCSG